MARGAVLALLLVVLAPTVLASDDDDRDFLACANQVLRVCYDPWQTDDGGTLRHSPAPAMVDALVCHDRVAGVPAGRLLQRKGWKVLLGNGTHERWASFNTVDESMRRCCPVDRFYIFSDRYSFNVLAHDVLCALRCCRIVPAAVVRRIDGLGLGALTQWVDCRADEMERAVYGVELPHLARMHNLTWLVSDLLADADRNVHNILYTRRDARLVLVDFTRAFRRSAALRHKHRYTTIEAPMWEALQRVRFDGDGFGAPTLDAEMRACLEARRAEMVAHFAGLIAERGGAHAVVLGDDDGGAQC